MPRACTRRCVRSDDPQLPAPLERYPAAALTETTTDAAVTRLRGAYNDALDAVGIEGDRAAAAVAGAGQGGDR